MMDPDSGRVMDFVSVEQSSRVIVASTRWVRNCPFPPWKMTVIFQILNSSWSTL
ncbi:MAG: hypothetical protein HGA65_19120 [Oscillochloris sp.]|nr:hypothetical protein [Oscillochloris sp.]